MSDTQRSFSGYQSQVWQRTSTPGVYVRGGYFIVPVRPDGKRKVIHRFETYADAATFKATTPNRRTTRRGAALGRKTVAVMHLRDDPCAYCGGPSEVVDHIVPRAAGGEDGWTNLTGACWSCNSSKRDMPLLLFLAHRHGCWQWHQAT